MIEIKNLSKYFSRNKGESFNVINELNLKITEGKFIAVVGPNGCGKTTFLRILAGLIKPTSGHILFEGNKSNNPGKYCSFVFQDYSLFPWLTVKENVLFGKRIKNNEKTKLLVSK